MTTIGSNREVERTHLKIVLANVALMTTIESNREVEHTHLKTVLVNVVLIHFGVTTQKTVLVVVALECSEVTI